MWRQFSPSTVRLPINVDGDDKEKINNVPKMIRRSPFHRKRNANTNSCCPDTCYRLKEMKKNSPLEYEKENTGLQIEYCFLTVNFRMLLSLSYILLDVILDVII